MRLPIWVRSKSRVSLLGGVEPRTTVRVSINEASRDELIAVKGIGEVMVDAIIAGRPWESLDDLTSIDGIGTKSLEALKEQIGL